MRLSPSKVLLWVFRVSLLLSVLLCAWSFRAGAVDVTNIDAADELSAIRMALELFYADAGRYPTLREGLALLCTPAFRGPYMEPVLLTDPWGRDYVYSIRDDGRPMAMTYGADGQPGGYGKDQDLRSVPSIQPQTQPGPDGA